jgi:hypothetical protein
MQLMRRISVKASWIFLALLFAAGTANAQLYRWVDKDGKVRYGDTPPPGAKTATIKAPPPGSAPPAAASKDAKDGKDGKAAKKGPLTAAEKEQEYRDRREEAKKAAEKEEEESRAKAARADNCDRAKEQLRTLQSGERIARTNSSGERYILSDSQLAQEVAKSQQSVAQACK